MTVSVVIRHLDPSLVWHDVIIIILVIILSTRSQAKTLVTIEYLCLGILYSCSALRVSSSSVSHSHSATETRSHRRTKKSEISKKEEKKKN